MEAGEERKSRRFLLEQHLPQTKADANANVKVPLEGHEGHEHMINVASDGSVARLVPATDHVQQAVSDSCRCIHLEQYFPHILDLQFSKMSHRSRSWVVSNPVHALHLESQLEDSSHSPSSTWKQAPLLYGEEQQRTMALSADGVVAGWPSLREDVFSADTHRLSVMDRTDIPASFSAGGASIGTNTSSSANTNTTGKTSQKNPQAVPLASHNPPPTTPSMALSTSTGAAASDQHAKRQQQQQQQQRHSTPLKSNQTSVAGQLSHAWRNESAAPISIPTPDRPSAVKSDTSLPNVVPRSNHVPDITASGSAHTASTNVHREKSQIHTTADQSIAQSTIEPPTTTTAPTSAPASSLSSATSGSGTGISATTVPRPIPPSQYDLPDHQFHQLRLEEDRMRLISRSISSQRLNKKKAETSKKKRKRENDYFKSPGIPGWRPPPPTEINAQQEREWKSAKLLVNKLSQKLLENFRANREWYWDEKLSFSERGGDKLGNFSLTRETNHKNVQLCCESCQPPPRVDNYWGEAKKISMTSQNKTPSSFRGDSLMRCLECPFVGCAPKSVARSSRQHILQHFLLTGHNFGVSCGDRARVFCFKCGDFVYHEIFQQERERIDIVRQHPFMGWREDVIHRSFYPFQYIKTSDHGVMWRGLRATYPHLVPEEHVLAAKLTRKRYNIFEGNVGEEWLQRTSIAIRLAAKQKLLTGEDKYNIAMPVGMYNLGNTCFKSAVLQCLVHCRPLQNFFLKDHGHHHMSCKLYRRMFHPKQVKDSKNEAGRRAVKVEEDGQLVCMACEMDRLMISYHGNAAGADFMAALQESSRAADCTKRWDGLGLPKAFEPGEPLIISDLLTASWKSGRMDHLAGYEQQDAHEFLNSFLNLMGKHSAQFRERIHTTINSIRHDMSVLKIADHIHENVAQNLFEGTLRSVLVCEVCAGKRVQCEPFMNISLTLSTKASSTPSQGLTVPGHNSKLSVETCLEHFILPEKLSDPVMCPVCGKKTSTKKQHTFSSLPKVLCLHLKRFDASRNRKITDFVSFPARGLNMGRFLSHWCEVSALPWTGGNSADPGIPYDLFGTVNHVGNMQSGHYVANVRVGSYWYHCNDEHVSRAGGEEGERTVLQSEGAYILFYMRRY